jgi:hypothetical protein
MNPKVVFIGLAVIGILFASGVGMGVGIPDPKGFSLKDPPGWLKSMDSLLSSESSTKIESKEIREETAGAKSEPFKNPVELGGDSEKPAPLERNFTVAKSSRSLRKLKLSAQGKNDVDVRWKPADQSDPSNRDQSFTLKPKAKQTVTVLAEGGKLEFKVKKAESAQVTVD